MRTRGVELIMNFYEIGQLTLATNLSGICSRAQARRSLPCKTICLCSKHNRLFTTGCTLQPRYIYYGAPKPRGSRSVMRNNNRLYPKKKEKKRTVKKEKNTTDSTVFAPVSKIAIVRKTDYTAEEL